MCPDFLFGALDQCSSVPSAAMILVNPKSCEVEGIPVEFAIQTRNEPAVLVADRQGQ
jgi:hypothetical protein